MTDPTKKKLLDAALAHFKRDSGARKTLAPIFEAAVRDSQWLAGYGLIEALREVSKLSGHDFGSNIPEAEMGKFVFVVLFTRRLVEHVEQRFDPNAGN